MTECPLAYSTVSAEGAQPASFTLVLHGILGRRTNWRRVAKALAARDPERGFVLVDLRGHGDSQGIPGPHDVHFAARDLDTLELPIDRVIGHSFGGKVALEWSTWAEGLKETWLIDSNPGVRRDTEEETTIGVLNMLAHMRFPMESREQFVERVEAHGFPRGVAQWLAMNLKRGAQGFDWSVDLDIVHALIDDYFERDLWPAFETPRVPTRLVIGGRSTTFTDAELERAIKSAEREPTVKTFVIKEAGHWVHVDAFDALVDLLSPAR